MKKILVIGTGGTIASAPTENGLAPALSADAVQILAAAAAFILCHIQRMAMMAVACVNLIE